MFQNSRHTMADPLSQVHGIIQDVMQGRREKLNHSQSLHVYDVILSLLNKVHQWVKKTVVSDYVLLVTVTLLWNGC